MFEELNTRPARRCRRKQVFTVILLIFLSSILRDRGQSKLEDASYAQEGAATCILKNTIPDCAVRSNEEVRTLRPGSVLEGKMASAERHLYKITLSSGQFFQTVVEQLGIDVTASICTQDGQQVAQVDRQSGSWGPETISPIAKASGEHLLQVRPLDGNGIGGRYEIKTKELRDSAPIDEVQVNAERIVTEGGKYFDRGKPDCLLESIKNMSKRSSCGSHWATIMRQQ